MSKKKKSYSFEELNGKLDNAEFNYKKYFQTYVRVNGLRTLNKTYNTLSDSISPLLRVIMPRNKRIRS